MLSVVVPPLFCTFPLCNFRYPNPSDRLIFVKVTGTFLGTNTNKILVFVIDDSLGMGGGVWWFKTSLLKENCLWERCKKKVEKTNKSAFSATHTYIKLTLVSFFLLFFYFAPSPPKKVEIFDTKYKGELVEILDEGNIKLVESASKDKNIETICLAPESQVRVISSKNEKSGPERKLRNKRAFRWRWLRRN